MAHTFDLQSSSEAFQKRLIRSLQSGHVNFLLGSGASCPAIPTAGEIEKEVATLFAEDKKTEAVQKLYEFLCTVWEPTNHLLSGDPPEIVRGTLAAYVKFVGALESVLAARRSTLLARQINVFSTNYDLFVESATASAPGLILNDGFVRSPGIGGGMLFSSRNFFRSVYSTGNLYDYKVEVPSLNLIKLHGSFSWKRAGDEIRLTDVPTAVLENGASAPEKMDFVRRCAVVLPQAAKFQETTMDRTYYDLLRIFANALDIENTLLLVIGFSFGDDHIRDIVLRSLKNPTLRVIVFAFDEAARNRFEEYFAPYQNVDVVWNSTENVSLASVGRLVGGIFQSESAA